MIRDREGGHPPVLLYASRPLLFCTELPLIIAPGGGRVNFILQFSRQCDIKYICKCVEGENSAKPPPREVWSPAESQTADAAFGSPRSGPGDTDGHPPL